MRPPESAVARSRVGAASTARSRVGAASTAGGGAAFRFALIALAAAAGAGCGPIGPRPGTPAVPSGWAGIVTTEKDPRGGHLVFVREDGTRTADLTDTQPQVVFDMSPSWSPDGKWIAFASNRGRANIGETSLWLIRAAPGQVPYRLTRGDAVESDPVWMPSGRAILFASNRAGTFDLWKLPLAPGADGHLRAAGAPVRITRTPLQALSPSPSPDGREVVYMLVDVHRHNSSSLWIARTDGRGAPRRLTRGPHDGTPAWSPDGKRIAFAAPAARRQPRAPAGAAADPGASGGGSDRPAGGDRPGGKPGGPAACRGTARRDLDLYTVAVDGSDRRVLADEPCADQDLPKWSRDGRYLFATSVYRSLHSRRPILSSVVVLDVTAHPHVLRALHDPAVVLSRFGVALAPGHLDAGTLRHDRPYAVALRQDLLRGLTRRLEEEREQQRRKREREQRHKRGGAPGRHD